MPQETPTAREVFLAALERSDPVERQAYLDRACSDNSALHQRVEALLKAHDAPESLLDQPAAGPRTEAYCPISEGPGSVIGPYKLLQQIGEGGFGVVFMAEQTQPVRRTVALKIIKPGMDTAQVIARFESERQALALMDHPNIAKVLDAGTTKAQGRPSLGFERPFFVMELVKGVPITEFCDKNHMPAEGRLKLFIDVCHAIQHAHHKGVIHRDIKPSNVMVTLHDGVPVVKVIDFGVAKATVQKLTEKTLFTAYGQMIGTPAYMSPEQAEMSGLDIDTRSDVYSLGVLLYELLTGTTPLEIKRLREAGYAEMQRMIREELAPRPSTRLSSLGDSATVLAGNRGLDVRRLVQLLSGDLDWVVMKALDKDRNRRYGTPGNFAEDVERYLRREAILARPPSAAYKLRNFAQRNRAAVLTAATILFLLLTGIAGTTFGLIHSEQRREEAELAREAEAEQRLQAVAAEELAGKRLVQVEAEKKRTEQQSRERADILQCLSFGSKAEGKSYEALDGELFAWAMFSDCNRYEDSSKRGYLASNVGVMSGRLTIVKTGTDVLLSTTSISRLPFKHEKSFGIQAIGWKFFEKPISPPYGRPFTVFQSLVEDSHSSVGNASSRFMIRDPFDPVEPLPPIGKSGTGITRVMVQMMKIDKNWYPPRDGNSISTEEPKELRAFFDSFRNPWMKREGK